MNKSHFQSGFCSILAAFACPFYEFMDELLITP